MAGSPTPGQDWTGPSVLHEQKLELAERQDMMSTVSRVTGDAPEAARSGATLRAARERLGWTLPEMAASLRISLTHLEALEDGHIGQLPGNAYAVGYVRSYARASEPESEAEVQWVFATANHGTR